MRVKQDAIPGIDDPGLVRARPSPPRRCASASATPEFVYEIACAQLCGLGHYRMRGFVTIDTPEDFQKWMDEQRGRARADAVGGDSVWK